MKWNWPLPTWGKKHGITSATQRRAVLSSTRAGYAGEQAVTLGDLREFVDALEAWPDGALVETTSGAMLEVSFTTGAPSLVKEEA